jgi:hypothetical protein
VASVLSAISQISTLVGMPGQAMSKVCKVREAILLESSKIVMSKHEL